MVERIVLVADPDPATPRKVERALAPYSLTVVGARSVQELESALEQGEPAALICALSLPDGSGYRLARDLRARYRNIGVFLLCGGFDALDPGRAQDSGMDAALRRPLSADGLVSQLEQVLGVLPPASSPASPPTGSPSPASPEPGPRPPLTGDERLATFIPHDYESLPPVRVDPEQISGPLEQAIMAALPEALEIVLEKNLRGSPELRQMVRETLERVARDLARNPGGREPLGTPRSH